MTWLRMWVIVVVLVVAACASDDPEPPAGDGDERPRVEAPKDRDPDAVMAAVRRIDFCAVAGKAAKSAGDPFSCTVSGVSVSVVPLGTDERSAFPVRAIGGAKAYVDTTGCVVYFPISFELAVKVDGAGCEPAIDLTLGATPRWDACGALGQALGDDGALIEAGANVGAACERLEPSLAHLDLGFENPLFGPTRTETVGGVRVEVQEDDSTGKPVCWTAWAAEPDLWAAVAASDCDGATALAESVMTVLKSPPPDVPPQDPLLYGPDEPDTPFAGACANLDPKVAENCRPYTETEVPADVLRAGADAQCAVVRDAVTTQRGSLTPVVVDDGESASCYFVEPERQLQVRVQVGQDPIDGVSEVFPAQEATIAGHPAYVEDGQPYRAWVATSDDPAKPGRLAITIEAGPAGQLPANAATTAESIIAGILAAHFS